MYPSPILLNFCWWCYHLCSTVFCQAWAVTTYIWNLWQRGGVCWRSLAPPPSPTEYSLRWVWPRTLYFNELCSRQRIIALVSCSASWSYRGCFLALRYHFVSWAAPIVDCLWISLALCYLWSLSVIPHIPVYVMVGNSIEFASLITQYSLMLHQKAYQNSKPQRFSHAAQAGFHPTKRLKGITVPCQASCFLPTVLQMTACRSVDPRAC